MTRKVNLNSDMGEGFGAYDIGNDTALLDIVTSANVACGFHAGDPNVMDRVCKRARDKGVSIRSEEHTSELQSLMRISYAVFCLKKKNKRQNMYKTQT